MSRKTESDMISIFFLVFGTIILSVAVFGEPTLLDSLDSNQKTCNQFKNCTGDLEVRLDQFQNGVIYIAMILIPAMSVGMIWAGICGFWDVKIPIFSKRSKNKQ